MASRAAEAIEVRCVSSVPAKIIPLPVQRRGLVWILGLGAFGLAFSLTTTSAYLPPLLGRFTDSRTLIALVLGSEGLFALTLPYMERSWLIFEGSPQPSGLPFVYLLKTIILVFAALIGLQGVAQAIHAGLTLGAPTRQQSR